MISYRESLKNHNLNRYIRPTSVLAYQKLWESGKAPDQCEELFKLYEDNPDGLTDKEALYFLRAKGLSLDAGTIPARRHDLNKAWIRKRDYAGMTDQPGHLIVSINRRKNPSGRLAEVWGINPQITTGEKK